MTSILYLAPVDWSSIHQRPQQLASRLGKQFDLHYVDPVGLRGARLSDAGRIFRRAAGAKTPAAPVAVLKPRYLPVLGWAALERLNRDWLSRQARAWLEGLQPGWILWVGSPSLLAETLIERFDPGLVVYDCMDYYAAFHRGPAAQRIEEAERRIVGRADLVLAASRELERRLKQLGGAAWHAPNGVDCDLFGGARRLSPPVWMEGIRGPVLGFHGTLGDWLDYELIEDVARHRPEWTLVLIGPEPRLWGRRRRWPANVRRVHGVAHSELPDQLAWFDVGMVPFLSNELTRYAHPIKALEYLAAGLPVVSTRLPGLTGMASVVRFAEGLESWIGAIESELGPAAHDAPLVASRRAMAAEYCWERLAGEIGSRLREAMSRSTREAAAA